MGPSPENRFVARVERKKPCAASQTESFRPISMNWPSKSGNMLHQPELQGVVFNSENARNGEVWNSCGELHRASFSGEASCQQTPAEFTDQSQQITTELTSLLPVPIPQSATGLQWWVWTCRGCPWGRLSRYRSSSQRYSQQKQALNQTPC